MYANHLVSSYNCFVYLSKTAYCADEDSRFIGTGIDILISGTAPVTVVSYTLTLTQTKNVLMVANGRYFPSSVNGMAIVNIRIDGNNSYSSASITEWNSSQNPVQHSFDCTASVTLNSGTHKIELIGYNHTSTPTGRFVVGMNSGLSIMTNPAPFFKYSTLPYDSPIIDQNTYGIGDNGDLPAVTLLTNNINVINQTSVVTLLSGRSYCAGGQGDALWGIYLNNQCPSNSTSNWSVNDIFSGAELHAPMFAFAMHNLIGNNSISFKATELSYGPGAPADLVQYRVGQDVRMVSLWGMGLSGSVIKSNLSCARTDWRCIGSSIGYGGCSPVGSNTLIAQATVTIPDGHNGIVLFKAAARLQPDANDNGGAVYFWINIDGIDVGASGVQQFRAPNSVSERTIGASYLSSGNNKLAPGQHIVKLYARAEGSFIHVSTTNELPLVYSD